MRKNLLIGMAAGILLLGITACSAGNDRNNKEMPKEPGGGMKVEETTMAGETKIIDENNMTDGAKITNETKMMDEANMTDETKMTDEANMMDETKMADKANMTDETKMADEANMMDETKMMNETEMTDDIQPTALSDMTVTTEILNQGTPAPDFEMMDLNGKTVKLSDFRGEKVYLKYWASWCPICLGGLEDINTLSASDSGFRVLTIVAPGQKGEKSMEDFKTWFSGVENTENITVLFDTDGSYGTQAGVRGYPTSEYIGSDGVLVKMVPGHADNDTIKAAFESIN